MRTLNTKVVIAGGGPAGIMLAYLLARCGIAVVVLEKWPDFFRDFRGDTIHPSIMENLHELGLLEKFLALPHNETRKLVGHVGNEDITVADFSRLPARNKFIAFIPQWDFLNFLAAEAKKFETFTLLMETEAVDLIKEGEKVVGLTAKSKSDVIEIRAELVVGADGRHSTLREKAELEVENLGVPIDVLWFRLSRRQSDPVTTLGRINFGKILVMIDRDDYWQCGFVIRKGQFEEIKKEGLENFQRTIVVLAPFLKEAVGEIKDWEMVKMLSVQVDHLKYWYRDGLICIGDSAHAMSPIGGVGINLAIQDAVAAGNILVPAITSDTLDESTLEKIQFRREKPVLKMQKLQVFMQDNFIEKILEKNRPIKIPWYLKFALAVPILRDIPPRIVGLSFQQEAVSEHITNTGSPNS